MIIGCPTEIKTRENRVGIIPASVAALVASGHKVIIQKGAGNGSGITDEVYKTAGAEIVEKAADVWGRADIICKVKEPLPPEYPLMRDGQILYTYLHLAPEPVLTQDARAQVVQRVDRRVRQLFERASGASLQLCP